MGLYTQLATGTITTTSAAAFTVPTGQVWKVQSITIMQPAAAVAKIVSMGTGTQATAANIKIQRTITGAYSEVIFPNMAVTAAGTFDVLASAGTTEVSYSIHGTKDLVA